MVRRPIAEPTSPDDSDDEEALWSSLSHYASAAQRKDASPDSVAAWPLWVQGRGWALRGAAVLAVLLLILGFAAGRSLSAMSFRSADATLFFLAVLSLSGEIDDIIQ